MQKSIVLLLLCLSSTLSTSNLLPCQPKNRSSVTLSLFYPVFVLLLPCLNLTLSQSGLVILATAIVVIIILNFEL